MHSIISEVLGNTECIRKLNKHKISIGPSGLLDEIMINGYARTSKFNPLLTLKSNPYRFIGM